MWTQLLERLAEWVDVVACGACRLQVCKQFTGKWTLDKWLALKTALKYLRLEVEVIIVY